MVIKGIPIISFISTPHTPVFIYKRMVKDSPGPTHMEEINLSPREKGVEGILLQTDAIKCYLFYTSLRPMIIAHYYNDLEATEGL